jgi:hypothetical protein
MPILAFVFMMACRGFGSESVDDRALKAKKGLKEGSNERAYNAANLFSPLQHPTACCTFTACTFFLILAQVTERGEFVGFFRAGFEVRGQFF